MRARLLLAKVITYSFYHRAIVPLFMVDSLPLRFTEVVPTNAAAPHIFMFKFLEAYAMSWFLGGGLLLALIIWAVFLR